MLGQGGGGPPEAGGAVVSPARVAPIRGQPRHPLTERRHLNREAVS